MKKSQKSEFFIKKVNFLKKKRGNEMKVLEELLNYRKNVGTIFLLEKEKEELEENRIIVSGPSYDVTGIRPKGYVTSNLDKNIIKHEAQIAKIDKKIKKIKRTLAIIESLILSLGEEQRRIIVGFYLEGKKNKKIAEEIDANLSVEAIKKRKKRIVKKMQKLYDDSIK